MLMIKTACTLLAASLFSFTATSCLAQNASSMPLDQQSRQSYEKRAAELVSRMTLEEKVSQMKNHAAAIPRLGIPEYDWWSEALHGVARAGYATVFPQAIGMAATWDTGLVHQEADIISTEARAKFAQAQAAGNHSIFHGLDFWSPNINIFRDPRWGRGQETYGEDPYLTGRLGIAFITGLQGNDPSMFKTIATAKHYAVHSGPESTRHKVNIDPSPHDLEDTYLPAFRAAITEGKSDSIMCAYNSVNGQPACANTMLLVDTLRRDWGFKGYVVSDCDAVDDMYSAVGHHFSPDAAHASALAVKAGTDLDCGTAYSGLIDAVHQKLISEADIDRAVTRLFAARYALGLFDKPGATAYSRIAPAQNDTEADSAVSLKAAQESIVLLRNQNHTLPLSHSIKTLAVIGPNAEDSRVLEGNYNGVPSHPVTPLAGIEKTFSAMGTKVLYEQGSPRVSELPLVVPSSAFVGGLKAEYFKTGDLTGASSAQQDSHIDFDWNQAAPLSVGDAHDFSVRWRGQFQPVAAGTQTFRVQLQQCFPCAGTTSYKIFFDGKQVAALSSPDNDLRKQKFSFTVPFANTNPVRFRMEYSHTGGTLGAGVTLKWQPSVEALRARAVDIAKQADAVIAVVGLSPDLEGEEMPVHIPGFSGGDRTDINLPAVQRQLLEAVASTGKPLIVVLTSGSAVAVDWTATHAEALLEAWYPGENGGTAIADVLSGKVNPAGRLPVTVYQSVDQLPAFEDYSMKGRTYRYFTQKPLYSFGYGLSYSNFAYQNLHLSSLSLPAGQGLHVDVDVENTSSVPGDEVAQLYLTPPSSPTNPLRKLVGFKRISIGAHQTQHVSFDVSPRSLSMVNEKGNRAVLPGSYTLFAGGAQPADASGGATQMFEITGTQMLPR